VGPLAKVKIAVDAMGGDHAPGCVIEGAALAVQRGALRVDELLLVGQAQAVRPLLASHGLGQVELIDAPEVVGMDESAATAIRTKKNSSIAVAMRAVQAGQAQAFVSAGNTGAVVAASSLVLGRLSGVSRPGIAAPVPSRSGPCIIIDVGANIYCKPEHMLQYAVMASLYACAAFDKDRPHVGLLNIGEEEGKGNELIQAVHGLLQASPLNYGGFVEGQDIMSGDFDVVVCEGFVGNAILKVAEGLGAFVREQVQSAFASHPPTAEVAEAVKEGFRKLDYAEYGGAPLLGVSAPVLIGHGRSRPHAIMNMLRAARMAVSKDVTRHILERLGQRETVR
jgi:glycerol-3-phosphate acyltransferase PlsX